MTTWMDDIEGWIAYFLSLFEVSGSSATGSGTNSSTVATTLSKTQIILGEQVTDSATVTGGGPTPTGNVDFYISYDSGSSWTKYDTQVLVSGSATSDPIAPSTVGTIYFKAKYSGDDYYAPAESDPSSTDEHLRVQKVSIRGWTSSFYPVALLRNTENVVITSPVIKIKRNVDTILVIAYSYFFTGVSCYTVYLRIRRGTTASDMQLGNEIKNEESFSPYYRGLSVIVEDGPLGLDEVQYCLTITPVDGNTDGSTLQSVIMVLVKEG
jgi:hypothetical protein